MGPHAAVLHSLRCLGASAVARVADATGRTDADVESALIDLGIDGLVTHDGGAFGGWRLTDAGRAADDDAVAAELGATSARDAVAAGYETFLELNPVLLDVCTAWQTRTLAGTMTINDHRDGAYDDRVLDRLGRLHRRADVVLTDLAAALPRFERYRTRLAAALVRAEHGELGLVADDLASYHNVWFQLHEDLLVTLGLPRH